MTVSAKLKTLPADPAVSVQELAGIVRAPLRFNRPAPPLMSITLVAEAEPVKVMPLRAFSWPVVMVILEMREVVVVAPLKVMRPVTVAEPALMSQELLRLLVVG